MSAVHDRDELREALRVLGVPGPFGAPSALLIDGRSGSGKTTLAARFAREYAARGLGAQILHVEDLYPGWDGLAEGSRAVAGVLERGEYRRYDWLAEQFAAGAGIEPGTPLIIEGCGAVTRPNLAAAERWARRSGLAAAGSSAGSSAVRSLWIECPEPLRRERALARDGDTFAPHWERWARQEQLHFAEHEPWLLADRVVESEVACASAASDAGSAPG